MTGPSQELQTLKAEFFRAMAHPARIRILEVLSDRGEHSVQALQEAGPASQPAAGVILPAPTASTTAPAAPAVQPVATGIPGF